MSDLFGLVRQLERVYSLEHRLSVKKRALVARIAAAPRPPKPLCRDALREIMQRLYVAQVYTLDEKPDEKPQPAPDTHTHTRPPRQRNP